MKIDKRKELMIFGAFICLFLSALSYLYAMNKDSIYLTVLMLTPAISVILTKLICKEKFDDLYLKPNIRRHKGWYLSAYFLTPVIAFAGAALYFIIFQNDLDLLGAKYAVELGAAAEKEYISTLLVMIPLAMLINPIMGIIPCLGEELAWRGYLLPRLNQILPVKGAVLADGLIWGLWHSPLIAMGYNYGSEKPVAGIIAMVIFCVIIGIIASSLFYKTKSVWCPVIFHASINGMDLYSPSHLFMSKTPNMFIGPDLLGIIGGIGFIITAVILFVKLKEDAAG